MNDKISVCDNCEQMVKYQERIAELESENMELKSNLADHKLYFHEIPFTRDAENAEMKSKIEELEAENKQLTKQLIDHNQTFHSEEDTVPYLRYEISTLKAKISTLEAEAEKLKGEIADLETNNECRKDLLEDYEDRIAHFEQLLGRYYERDVARDKGRLQRAREYFKEALERHE